MSGFFKKRNPFKWMKTTLATFDATAERYNSIQVFLLCV